MSNHKHSINSINSVSKEIRGIKKNKVENLELENSKLLDRLSRMETTKERIRELENRSIKIIQSE